MMAAWIEDVLIKEKASYHKGRSFAEYSTLGVGGPFAYLWEPKTSDEMERIYPLLLEKNIPLWIGGGGSNTLYSDQFYPGVFLRMNQYQSRVTEDEHVFYIDGDMPLGRWAYMLYQWGFQGADDMWGIPGSLLGSVVQNAGVHSGVCSWISKIKTLSPTGLIEEKSLKTEDFSYRKGPRLKGHILLGVEFRKKKEENKENRKIKQRGILEKRSQSQPVKERSLGCVFKNPKEMSAGHLIELSGMKGKSCGDIVVSEKHANFFINRQRGTSQDFQNLINDVREAVYRCFRIILQTEIVIGPENQ